MKNKTNKIFAIVCFILVAILCLSVLGMGCLTAIKLNKINESTKEANNLMELQLNKLSKQEAYDILNNANTNMKLLNIRNTPYMYEEKRFDQKEKDYKAIIIPTEKSLIQKLVSWNDEENKYSEDYQLTKLDINDRSKTYVYRMNKGEEVVFKPSNENWLEIKSTAKSFNNEDIEALKDFNIDNMLSYSCDENGVYTFNVVISNVYDANSDVDIVSYSKYKYFVLNLKRIW